MVAWWRATGNNNIPEVHALIALSHAALAIVGELSGIRWRIPYGHLPSSRMRVSRTPPTIWSCAAPQKAMGDSPNPNYIIVPGLVPLVDKRAGEIEYGSQVARRLRGAST
jgi:hypothetical protein